MRDRERKREGESWEEGEGGGAENIGERARRSSNNTQEKTAAADAFVPAAAEKPARWARWATGGGEVVFFDTEGPSAVGMPAALGGSAAGPSAAVGPLAGGPAANVGASAAGAVGDAAVAALTMSTSSFMPCAQCPAVPQMKYLFPGAVRGTVVVVVPPKLLTGVPAWQAS